MSHMQHCWQQQLAAAATAGGGDQGSVELPLGDPPQQTEPTGQDVPADSVASLLSPLLSSSHSSLAWS